MKVSSLLLDSDGDYIILNVGVDGKIESWSEPEFNQKEWAPAVETSAAQRAHGR